MKLQRAYRRLARQPIQTFWWQYQPPEKLNFGDELTPYLIKSLFKLPVVRSEPTRCELVGVGSVIEIIQNAEPAQAVKIWGSGFIKNGPPNTLENLEFHAVRGKLSRQRVANKDAALGDPGILMPLAYSPPTNDKKYKLGIVAHYVDKGAAELKALEQRNDVKIIDVFGSVEKVVDDIVSCELVFSSSLHGLIISDAYSVPNYWLPLSENVTGGGYKFRDYYSVFGMEPPQVQVSQLDSYDYRDLVATYEPKKLDRLREELIAAFPY